jgi:hypothetical protein
MRSTMLLCALSACGGGEPAGNPDGGSGVDGPPLEDRWFPFVEGASWTFRVTPLGAPSEEKTQTVMGLEAVPGKTGVIAYRVRTEKIDGVTTSWQEDLGTRLVRHREQSFDIAGTMTTDEIYEPFKLRLDESAGHTAMGASWMEIYTETINGGAPISRSETWTVEAVAEAVTVPAGTFDCLRVRRMGTELGQADKIFWFARGVGKIKEEGDQVEELMDHSLP